MAKIQAVWAIDIGQAALKALKLIPAVESGKLFVEAFDFVEYPKILSQPDADPEELVREALGTFLERNEVKGSKVALGVSGQAGLVKFIKLPPVEKKRIPDIVKFEARQQIPFALEEVIWDYQAIVGDDEDPDEVSMTEVGLFAMKRDQINRAILPLKNAGIEVDVVQMTPIALYNYIAFDGPPPKPESADAINSYVVLDIGADNTDLIITDGTRIWQRNVPIGGNHFTRALTKEMKLTFAKAEHLKRNATKAQDPRAVFMAMRGIFTDFSSEVSRSIGFYSSVNRNATIVKVMGLGNGFKLPGLQKFLQQNLNFDVERVESFKNLEGEELTRPQFVENLASFGVAYGLAVQALGLGPMQTNLLPPEIEQTRMIRRKKPWALVASTLLMLGFSAMYFSAWNALARTKPFEGPVSQAQSVTTQAKKYETDYEGAKGQFNKVNEEGKSLVGDAREANAWPFLLKTVMTVLPNPAREFQGRIPNFDPNNPAFVGLMGMNRVHVDIIEPVWREDLAAGWYDLLEPEVRATMHALDREKPPSGAGWVIQVVGHHYNPHPIDRKDELSPIEKQMAKGPWNYIQEEILPRFWLPRVRLEGFSHAALTWYFLDRDWTTDKGNSAVPPPSMLAREVPSAGEGGNDQQGQMLGAMGGMGGPGGGAGMPGMTPGGMPGMTLGEGLGSGGMGGAGALRGSGGMPGMAGMPGLGGMGPAGKADPKDRKTLTRTDFKLEFAWQPPDPETAPQTPEEEQTKAEEIRNAMAEAAQKLKGAVSVDPARFADLSFKRSLRDAQQAQEQLKKASEAASAAEGATAPGDGQAEGTAPAPPQ